MGSQQTDFKWRCQPASNSYISRVLEYINNPNLHPTITKNEMIIKALSAFYLPIACKEVQGELSQEQIDSIAYESIFELQNQSRKIALQQRIEINSIPTIEIEEKTSKKQEEQSGDSLPEANDNYDDLNIDNFTISV